MAKRVIGVLLIAVGTGVCKAIGEEIGKAIIEWGKSLLEDD
jgi:hypothetical protein